MDKPLHITLLGGFSVSLNGHPVHGFESDKARALLGYLCAEGDRPHRRERLAGLLWPDLTEKRARRNLSQTLYNLRQVLEATDRGQAALFSATQHDIRFAPGDGVWLDISAFRTGVAGCARHAPEPSAACATCLAGRQEAVSLYRGELLAGFSLPDCSAFEEWLLLQRERLQRTALATLGSLAASYRRRGDFKRALAHARRAVALDPLWEPAQREVMHVLWLTGRRAEALTHYAAVRQLLMRELGVEPDEVTRQLARRIQSDSEIVAPPSRGRHNLPHPLTPFIGREREVAQIQNYLDDPAHRLITILGPGGSGKSRLAVEAARPLIADFPDGLFMLSLSGLNSSAALLPALAEVLGVPNLPDRNPEPQLFDYLKNRRLLLILDSCEALSGVAELGVSILREAPRAKILATTRIRLNVQSETVHHLGGLALPGASSLREARRAETIRLFLSAAQRAVPGYEPDDAALQAIIDICRLAQGMPLAIILATAWLELMSPPAIAAAMAGNLDFLAVEWPDLPLRQRSLRGTLEYTWNLLTSEQRRHLQALSVFQGGFDSTAAEQVTGASARDLLALLNRSVIQRLVGDRYGIHDLLRQFVAEKLAAEPEVLHENRGQHGRYFLGLLAGRNRDLKRDRQQEALAQMDRESRNLASAWVWAVEQGEIELLDRALEGMCLYYELRVRYREGMQACAAAAKTAGADSASAFHLQTRIWQARFARLSGYTPEAEKNLAACCALDKRLHEEGSESSRTRGLLQWELGESRLHTDRQASRDVYLKSVALFKQAGATWWTARACSALGETHHLLGQYAEAINWYRKSLAMYSTLGDPRGSLAALNGLGHNCFRIGHYEEGERHLRDAIDTAESLGDGAEGAIGLLSLSRFYWWRGRFAEAGEIGHKLRATFRDLGLRHELAFMLAGRSMALLHTGAYQRTLADVDAIRDELKDLAFPRFQAMASFVRGAALLAQGLQAHAWAPLQEALALTRAIDQEEELASTLAVAAAAALEQHRWEMSRRLLEEALVLCLETRGHWAAIHTLPIVALWLAEKGQLAQALEIYALADNFPAVANSAFFRDVARQRLETRAAALFTGEIEAARVRGGKLNLWKTVSALAGYVAEPG